MRRALNVLRKGRGCEEVGSEFAWKALAEGSLEDRRQIELDAAVEAATSKAQEIRNAVQELREILFFIGKKATDDFYKESKAHQFKEGESLLSPRVRWDDRTRTPSFSWERIRRNVRPLSEAPTVSAKGKGYSYVSCLPKKDERPAMKVKILLTSEYIPLLKRTFTVGPNVFRNEPDWAAIGGQQTEEDLAQCRRISASLAKVTQQLALITRTLEKF